MAINKKLLHFKTFANFNSQKLSANEENTSYTIGVDGAVTSGAPVVRYESICWIKDTKQMWTHGQLYDCSGGSSDVDFSEYLTAEEIAEIYATIESLDGKQDPLVSGTNIKTINNQSLLGSGNLTISPLTSIFYVSETSAATPIPMNIATVVTMVSTTSKTFTLATNSAVTNPAQLTTEQKWSLIFGISASLSSAPSITFNTGAIGTLYWANGTEPTFEVGKYYEVSFLNVGGVLLGVCGTFSASE